MAMPAFQKFFHPVLEYAKSKGEEGINAKDATNEMIKVFGLTEEDQTETVSSGIRRVEDRTRWALAHLQRTPLMYRESRGVYIITSEGQKTLESLPQHTEIDMKYLLKNYESYREYRRTTSEKDTVSKDESTYESDTEPTPTDEVESIIKKYTESVEVEILEMISKAKPEFLERLVPQLLKKMKYGERIKHTGKSHDMGIDAIVYKDPLGFDRIVVQAKRYSKTVPIGDVRAFKGVISDKPNVSGLFVTTSTFSAETKKEMDEKSSMVLMDGKTLAHLLYKYGLGVTVGETYDIKRIDEDFFD